MYLDSNTSYKKTMSEQMTVEMSEQIKRITAFKEMLMEGEDKNE
ncbi:hypothetical protein [Aminicella lysinilytica]|uniref:Uncharacterized protein n=1 Tax=Aminicella lysinilytica TaxID=433323 RepID=A0A4R6PY38_9FIRM|nr:hypothetical protein [Aminicella lysinilytica]TDP44673.1 hypothetical protein EV211_1715 [Aminicella lysinilytica]